MQRSTLIFTERIYRVIAESKLKITATPYAEQLSQKDNNLESLPCS